MSHFQTQISLTAMIKFNHPQGMYQTRLRRTCNTFNQLFFYSTNATEFVLREITQLTLLTVKAHQQQTAFPKQAKLCHLKQISSSLIHLQ